MNMFFKNVGYGGQLLALVIIFVALFIVGTGMAFLPVLFGYDATNLASQAVSQLVTFAGSALLFSYLFSGNTADHLKLTLPSRPVRTAFCVLILFLLVLPASDWLAVVNDGWHLPQGLAALERTLRDLGEVSQRLLEGFLLREGGGDLAVNLLVLALVPALCEELFFRGALQQLLAGCLGGRHNIAIWLTAAVFSLMHGDLFAFLPRLLLGAFLGYLFHYGGSLWVNAAAHFFNNASVVVLYFLAARGIIDVGLAESLGLPFVVVVLSLVVCVVLFWLFFVRKEKK